jgi:hypothetical protein
MAGAASDATAVPIKNRDFRVYFSVYSGTSLVSSIGTPDSERSLDGAAAADCSNEAVAIAGMDGRHYLDLNASEMNTYWTGVQVEGTNCDPTHINLYPQTTDINGLEDFVSDIYSDTTIIVPKTSDTHSRLVVVETALDSDALLDATAVSDVHSRLVVMETANDSDHLITSDELVKIYSDTTLIVPKTSDTHSRLVVVETALDSDALIADSWASDILSAVTKVYSDTSIIYSDTSIIYSDTTVITSDVAEMGTGGLY